MIDLETLIYGYYYSRNQNILYIEDFFIFFREFFLCKFKILTIATIATLIFVLITYAFAIPVNW